eukprot:7961328-Karenia_brevis.AAC.1
MATKILSGLKGSENFEDLQGKDSRGMATKNFGGLKGSEKFEDLLGKDSPVAISSDDDESLSRAQRGSGE